MSIVTIARCPSYSPEVVTVAVDRALELLGGIKRYVRPGNRVLLKVNLLSKSVPEKAVVTHPEVVRALIRSVRSAGGVPSVGDCSGWEGPASAGRYRDVCREAGILRLCEEEGAELVHLSGESVEVENPSGRAFKRFTLARAVVEADVLISLPKLKTHGLTLFTGGVKNNFGTIPGLLKAQMHLRAQEPEAFSQMLVDLLLAVRPRLTLMDAVVGMEGNGPGNGRPRQVGAILASTDAVALDAVACEIVGIEPMRVHTTRIANEQGAGVGELSRILVRGETLDQMRVPPFQLPGGHGPGIPKFLGSFAQGRMVAKPVVRKESCAACWTCVEHCPAGALAEAGRYPAFDYGKCIRCYCCQELCPHDAIQLQRPIPLRWIAR